MADSLAAARAASDEAAAAAARDSPHAAGVKRKRGGPAGLSARSVANLSPEQLERKRRNDREVSLSPFFLHHSGFGQDGNRHGRVMADVVVPPL
jgi:hypothetical protein